MRDSDVGPTSQSQRHKMAARRGNEIGVGVGLAGPVLLTFCQYIYRYIYYRM